MLTNTVKIVRDTFVSMLRQKKFTNINREASMSNIVGSKTIEITGASFFADETSLFGSLNETYLSRELDWYMSQSLNVHDIIGGAPQVWKAVADADGMINSNYGWCVFSAENYSQYSHVVEELKRNPESRRAQMIYNRPSMWNDYNSNGKSDYMCTNCVQYLVRDGACHAVVQMRSNDAHIGYKNDRAWQSHVLNKLSNELNVDVGQIMWNVGSLHVYERDFYLVHHYGETGEWKVTKKSYKALHPDSEYLNEKSKQKEDE
jgi:thymidylate synthase